MISNWGVQYTIGRNFLKIIRNCPCMFQIGYFEEDMNVQNFGIIRVLILGLSLGSLGKKCHFDVAPTNSQRLYYRGMVLPFEGCRLCKSYA